MGGFIAARATISGAATQPGIPLNDSPQSGLYHLSTGIGIGVSFSGVPYETFDPYSMTLGNVGTSTFAHTLVNSYASANTRAVAISKDGAHVYAATSAGNLLRLFGRNQITGVLTLLETYAVTTTAEVGICISPDGRHVYVTNAVALTITRYSRDPLTGRLTLLGTTATVAGKTPSAITVTPSGNYVILASGTGIGTGGLSVYSRNTVTGALTVVGGVFAAARVDNAHGLAVSPDSSHVFVAQSDTNNVAVLNLSGAGVLSHVAGSPFACGVNPFDVTISPDGASVYVTNGGANTLSAFSRDPITGILTPLTGSPYATGNTPVDVNVSPDGLHVFVSNFAANTISIYDRSVTGTLSATAGSPFATPIGAGPNQMVMSPDGLNSIIAGTGTNTLIVYQNVVNGVHPLVQATFDPSGSGAGVWNVFGSLKVNGESVFSTPDVVNNAGKFLLTNGSTISWSFVTQSVAVAMVANAGAFTIDDSASYVVDVNGALGAAGALTGTLTNPLAPVHVTFHNNTTGGFPLVLNAVWTIPPGTSDWFWNGATFHLEGAEPFSTASVTPLPAAGAAVTINHLCGVAPQQVMVVATCITAEFNYAAGDHVQVSEQLNAALVDAIPIWFSATQAGFSMAAGYSLSAHDKVTGAHVVLTPANWSYNFMVQP